jgi:hypothetical protein
VRSCAKLSNSTNVSERLDTLSDQHPRVSEALITISGNVRHTATLLEVLF